MENNSPEIVEWDLLEGIVVAMSVYVKVDQYSFSAEWDYTLFRYEIHYLLLLHKEHF